MLTRIAEFLARFKAVRGKEYKSSLRQYWEMLWLFLRLHLSPTEYYLYGMARRGMRFSRLKEYIITHWAVKELRPRLNSRLWEPVLRNKILFHQHLVQHDLPGAKFFGLFQPYYGYATAGGPLRSEEDFQRLVQDLAGREIIIKPLDGLKGAGIYKFHIGEEGQLLNPQGVRHSLKDVVQEMSRGNGYIIEECLFNHPELQALNASSLNTCRIVTLVTREGGCRILFATARFGRARAVTDNWSAGGVAVGIDVATGTMGRGLLLPQFGGEWLDSHPDSGVAFVGKVLPHWTETMALVKRAALTLPWCNGVGWDVAITPQGPMLVEGNGQWNPSIGQAFTGGLLTSELRRELAQLGVKLPS